jgi:hypothetical protein
MPSLLTRDASAQAPNVGLQQRASTAMLQADVRAVRPALPELKCVTDTSLDEHQSILAIADVWKSSSKTLESQIFQEL